jgi:hypothetical protein
MNRKNFEYQKNQKYLFGTNSKCGKSTNESLHIRDQAKTFYKNLIFDILIQDKVSRLLCRTKTFIKVKIKISYFL